MFHVPLSIGALSEGGDQTDGMSAGLAEQLVTRITQVQILKSQLHSDCR